MASKAVAVALWIPIWPSLSMSFMALAMLLVGSGPALAWPESPQLSESSGRAMHSSSGLAPAST